ncbi:hypothetical protein IAR50_001733 [Cryptococcus sp. DSM 104548]
MFKIITSLTALALLVATSAVSAADFRLLANKPDAGSIEDFKINFKTQCPFFDHTSYASHRDTYFVAGDWKGQNTTSQALVFCTYTYQNGSAFAVTRELVESMGGSIVN